MRNICFIMLLFLFTLNLWSQTDIDLKSFVSASFSDSGETKSGMKEGKWIEYSIDSTGYNQTFTATFGSKEVVMDIGIKYIRQEGNYIDGLRSGRWLSYSSYDTTSNKSWLLQSTIHYSKGLKHGKETLYQSHPFMPLVEGEYRHGKVHGKAKIYSLDYPYLLEASWYFISGKPKSYTKYYSNGNIKEVNPFRNGVREGLYKYYYEDGTLWQVLQYKGGMPWKIILNHDINGNPQDKGTLKNGTGTVIFYDTSGNQTGEQYFEDGIRVYR